MKLTNHKRAVQITILVIGFLFMGIGVVRGEVAEVYQKAVQICLSCMGIG